jgi:GNAT superfamily N-acetyltransferase
VRDIAPHDRPQWQPLCQAYQPRGKKLPDDITDVTWRRFFDDAEPVHALVAEEGDTLIGFAHYLFHRSTARIAPTCYLQDMFTAEQARGRGVGHALLEAVCTRAKAAGAYRVYWSTNANNTAARALYDKVATLTSFVQYRIDF